MKEFIKSNWFPLVLFVVLELVAFVIGSFFYPMCFTGVDCPSMAMAFLLLATIPNGIITLVVGFLIKKFYK